MVQGGAFRGNLVRPRLLLLKLTRLLKLTNERAMAMAMSPLRSSCRRSLISRTARQARGNPGQAANNRTAREDRGNPGPAAKIRTTRQIRGNPGLAVNKEMCTMECAHIAQSICSRTGQLFRDVSVVFNLGSSAKLIPS